LPGRKDIGFSMHAKDFKFFSPFSRINFSSMKNYITAKEKSENWNQKFPFQKLISKISKSKKI
jgi:hypothetical protein